MDSKVYLLASLACLGTLLTGLAVLGGVMYWQEPYVGLAPVLAVPLGLFGFALAMAASFKMGDL